MGIAWIISAFASALGISIGGGLAWAMKGFQRGFGYIYSLCAGLIVGLLFLEMIPESIELGGWVILAIGIAIGLFLFQYIHHLIGKITIITDSHQKDIFVRSGLLLTLSIAFHNLPVGIALGSTIGTDFSDFMLSTLIIHNIPEGIIVFTPLFLAGFGIFTWVIVTVLISIPIALGAMLGQFIDTSITSLAFIINLAISIIFMVAVKEIFKEAVKNLNLFSSTIMGIVGFIIIYLYMNLPI
ncbi:ZIP family metal transporter [Oceanobacillus kapialis]|uniref:ZIP family metal transporter n=1 Tax=Oceanobacillus kapialis TaxID=481353 RepID=A0ABW5Q0Q2_9BACI